MEDTALLFAALADVNRLRLLSLMRHGEVCVCFLHGALKANQPRVSRHLAYLRRAGLVEATRKGKWQYYRLKQPAKPLQYVLECALDAITTDTLAKRDRDRVKQICCSPTKFGLSDPAAGERSAKSPRRNASSRRLFHS